MQDFHSPGLSSGLENQGEKSETFLEAWEPCAIMPRAITFSTMLSTARKTVVIVSNVYTIKKLLSKQNNAAINY